MRLGVDVRDAISYQTGEDPSVILLGRVSTSDTYLDKVIRVGAGVYDIDASRVPAPGEKTGADGYWGFQDDKGWNDNNVPYKTESFERDGSEQGRFPPNVILTEATAPVMDEQSGEVGSVVKFKQESSGINRERIKVGFSKEALFAYGGDTSGVSRFYHHFDTLEDVIAYLDQLFAGPTFITT